MNSFVYFQEVSLIFPLLTNRVDKESASSQYDSTLGSPTIFSNIFLDFKVVGLTMNWYILIYTICMYVHRFRRSRM